MITHNSRGRLRGLLAACSAAALAAVVALAVAGPGTAKLSRSSRHLPDGTVVLAGARAFHFDALPPMVATSTAVVRARVTAAARGTVIEEPDITFTRLRLTLEVERHLSGRPLAGSVSLETAGWQQVRGRPETRLVIEGDLPLEVGDRGIFFLYDFGEPGTFGLVSEQGVVLVRETATVQTDRSDTLVRGLERRRPAELEELTLGAARDVRLGQVAPIRPPTQR